MSMPSASAMCRMYDRTLITQVNTNNNPTPPRNTTHLLIRRQIKRQEAIHILLIRLRARLEQHNSHIPMRLCNRCQHHHQPPPPQQSSHTHTYHDAKHYTPPHPSHSPDSYSPTSTARAARTRWQRRGGAEAAPAGPLRAQWRRARRARARGRGWILRRRGGVLFGLLSLDWGGWG